MPDTKVPTFPGLLLLESPGSPAERSFEKRRIRKHQVLQLIRMDGPIPRVQIARSLGYNLPTVSSLVDELVRDGLALEETARKTSLGRRPIPVSLNSKAASVLGIDMGRRMAIGVLMDLSGSVLTRVERKKPTDLTPEQLGAWVRDVADEVFASLESELPPLAGIGVALSGLVHLAGDPAPMSPEAQAIHSALTDQFDVPVMVENDSRMMALGAIWFENMPDLTTFMVVNIGPGLGSGMVINGKIYKGYDYQAGELGHLPIGQPGIPCYCGGTQCLENSASGSGIERLAKEAGLVNGSGNTTFDEVLAMAREGNPKARQVVDDFTHYLAVGIATAVNLLNPQTVILAGRVARSADLFIDELREHISKNTIPMRGDQTEIIVSRLKEDAAPFGACASVLHHIFSSAHISVESIL